MALNMRLTGEDEQEVTLTGTLRPFVAEEMAQVRTSLEQAAKTAKGTLCVNLKRLKYMNNVAFLELNRFVRWVARTRPDLRIKFILSSVIPWAIRKFQVIAELYPAVSIEVYDKAFYPVQPVIEDDEFITVLRTQEKLIWAHEQEILPQHGLRPGLRVADICCGLGDFAILLQRDFRPEYLVGVDHSKPLLRYARQVVSDFGLENIEYQYGDAAALLLADNSFDFVSCRLSLQVFPEPDRIVHELVRITRPGGRVYITNEMLSSVVGYPQQEAIRKGYERFLEVCRHGGVDLDMGPKAREVLANGGLEDVKISQINVTNTNSDAHDLARVVELWIRVAWQFGAAAGANPEMHKDIETGLRAHIDTILSDRGYAVWPIIAASGRKPFRTT
ncbi:methyltransferase domain-containing protein [Polyangium aurulentum]|nr:methyltransferase domain-containing protein [Polyangium aurulentum]